MELNNIMDTEKLFSSHHYCIHQLQAATMEMFRRRNIARRRVFVCCNGDSSWKIDFVGERSRVKIDMHRRNDGSSSCH